MWLCVTMAASHTIPVCMWVPCSQRVMGSRFRSWAQKLPVVTEVFHGFSQSLKGNAGIAPQVRDRLCSSTSFPLDYSLLIVSFDRLVSFSVWCCWTVNTPSCANSEPVPSKPWIVSFKNRSWG
jgi:hypothetical protein